MTAMLVWGWGRLVGMSNNNNIYLKSNIQCISTSEFSGLYTKWALYFKTI